jgi:hypothetical protein
VAYRTSIRMPGVRADDDVRYWVTIQADELPWPLTFYFLDVLEDDGTHRWGNVGFDMGIGPVSRSQIADNELEPRQVELSPEGVRWVMESFFRYRRLARAALEADDAGAASTRRALLKSGRQRREMSDDFLSRIAHEYEVRSAQGQPAANAIALEHGVNRSTAWRWIQAAREKGHLPKEQS